MNKPTQTPAYLIQAQNKPNPRIIDEIFTALNKQGRQCMNGLSCVYDNSAPHTAPDGANTTPKSDHCAIGFLLDPQTPEDLDRLQAYEGPVADLVSDILDEHPGSLGTNEAYLRANLSLLEAAQYVHDWWSPNLSSMRRHPDTLNALHPPPFPHPSP